MGNRSWLVAQRRTSGRLKAGSDLPRTGFPFLFWRTVFVQTGIRRIKSGAGFRSKALSCHDKACG
jgi:hypothetical protein